MRTVLRVCILGAGAPGKKGKKTTSTSEPFVWTTAQMASMPTSTAAPWDFVASAITGVPAPTTLVTSVIPASQNASVNANPALSNQLTVLECSPQWTKLYASNPSYCHDQNATIGNEEAINLGCLNEVAEPSTSTMRKFLFSSHAAPGTNEKYSPVMLSADDFIVLGDAKKGKCGKPTPFECTKEWAKIYGKKKVPKLCKNKDPWANHEWALSQQCLPSFHGAD